MGTRLSKGDFLDKIDKEFSWRKKELIVLKLDVNAVKDKRISTEIRKGILLLYAHWEGFIKNAAMEYLYYVSQQRLKTSQLTYNFLCIMFRKHFQECANSQKISSHIEIIKKLFEDNTIKFDPKRQIRTESNLSFSLFVDIMLTIGLDHNKYDSKKHLIDESLLSKRNSIAHGEYLEISRDNFISTFDAVIEMLNCIKTDIQNACILESFKRDLA